jgi:hypothetical protein
MNVHNRPSSPKSSIAASGKKLPGTQWSNDQIAVMIVGSISLEINQQQQQKQKLQKLVRLRCDETLVTILLLKMHAICA